MEPCNHKVKFSDNKEVKCCGPESTIKWSIIGICPLCGDVIKDDQIIKALKSTYDRNIAIQIYKGFKSKERYFEAISELSRNGVDSSIFQVANKYN